MSRLGVLKQQYARFAARRDLVLERKVALDAREVELRAGAQDHSEALPLILQIGQLYRQLALEKAEALVTAALQAVFEHPYQFQLKQEEKRGQVEVTPVVRDGDLELDPVTSMGGGIVDVISTALRIVLWSMMKNRSSPVLVMDEPARLVNSERSVRNLAEMFKQISEVMGVQFLIVTNRPGLAHRADVVFSVSKKSGVSEVTRNENGG